MKLLIAFAFFAVGHAAIWEPAPREKDTENWLKAHAHLVNQSKTHAAQVKVVFLGDSITAHWLSEGKALWTAHYATRGAFNYGIGGDRTENVLWRIAHGEFDGLDPKFVVLMIGTNNFNDRNVTAPEIAKGIHAILDALHTKLPKTKVLLLSLLPRMPERTDVIVHEINKLIQRFADNQKVHYLDLAVHYELSLGHEIVELYALNNTTHLSEKGYQMWYKVMEATFKQLLAD